MIAAPTSTHTYPKLMPITSEWMETLVKDKSILEGLVERHGSPINLLQPSVLQDNHATYHQLLEEYEIDHQVFFARKANKCRAFVEAARDGGFGVDTASFRELQQCIDVGCSPENLVLTAAIKNRALLELAFHHDVLVMLDNIDEFELAQRIAVEKGKQVSVGIRISGFEFEGKKLYSRFGIDIDTAYSFITNKWQKKYPNLTYRGIHFHLNGYSRPQRSEALLQSIALAERIAPHGYQTEFIDMGGGLLMNYLTTAEEWQQFHQALRRSVKGEQPPITFGNNGLGLELIDGEIHGTPNVYPYYNASPRTQFLSEVLDYQTLTNERIGQLLRKNNIQLRLEPGRSLLDQTGMTVAKVAFRKIDSRGDLLIGLEMNRTQMFSSSADYLLDPVVISMSDSNQSEVPASGYFVGAYCLEQDVILKRKINLQRTPEIGDLVCFFNTAGYMMHFYETEAHLFPLAVNLIYMEEGWRVD